MTIGGKIAILSPGDLTRQNLRGGERHALEVARRLADRGHEVRLIGRGPQAVRTQRDGLELIQLGRVQPRPGLWRLGRIALIGPLARALGPYLSDRSAAVSFSPWMNLAARRTRPSLPIVYIVSSLLAASRAATQGRGFRLSNDSWLFQGPDAWLERRALLAGCDRLVCHTRTLAKALTEAGLGRGRIRWAWPGVPERPSPPPSARAASLRRSLNLPDHARLLVWIGAMTPNKNPLALAEALGQTPPEVHAVFCGEGPQRDPLDKLARTGPAAGRLHSVGWVEHTPAWLAAGDAFCHTAAYETFGLVYAEALAAGRAIIAPAHDPPTTYSFATEIIQPTGAGLVYDRSDPMALARTICQLIDQPELFDQLGQAALGQAGRMSWTRRIDEIQIALGEAMEVRSC